MYGDLQFKDKTVATPSYLYNENPYTGKTACLYWDGSQTGSCNDSLWVVSLNIHLSMLLCPSPF